MMQWQRFVPSCRVQVIDMHVYCGIDYVPQLLVRLLYLVQGSLQLVVQKPLPRGRLLRTAPRPGTGAPPAGQRRLALVRVLT